MRVTAYNQLLFSLRGIPIVILKVTMPLYPLADPIYLNDCRLIDHVQLLEHLERVLSQVFLQLLAILELSSYFLDLWGELKLVRHFDVGPTLHSVDTRLFLHSIINSSVIGSLVNVIVENIGQGAELFYFVFTVVH